MKILRLLNKKKFFLIVIISLFSFSANAENEPTDIWNIEKKKLDQNSLNNEITSNKNSVAQENSLNDIFKMAKKIMKLLN